MDMFKMYRPNMNRESRFTHPVSPEGCRTHDASQKSRSRFSNTSQTKDTMKARRPSISSESRQSRTPQKKTQYFFGVAIGRKVGVFASAIEAREHTQGFSKAYFKKFKTKREAREFVEDWRSGGTGTRDEVRKEVTIPTKLKTKREAREFVEDCRSIGTGTRDDVRKEETFPTNNIFYLKDKSNLSKTVVKETTTKHEFTERGESCTTTTSTTTTITTTIYKDNSRNPVEHCRKRKHSVSEQTDGNSEDEWQRHTKRRRRFAHAGSSQSPPSAPSEPEMLRVDIQIVFDGGSRGNPVGVGGAGAVVTISGVWDSEEPPTAAFRSRSYHVRHYIGADVNSNEAEYHGLLIGLLVAKREATHLGQAMELTTTNLHVRGDSNLVIEQLQGSYRCKDKKLIPLFNEANQVLDLLSSLGKCNVCLEHIYRDNNAKADDLANQAMDCRRSWFTMSDDNHHLQHDTSIFLNP